MAKTKINPFLRSSKGFDGTNVWTTGPVIAWRS